MKLLATFFAFFVLLLTSQPALNLLNQQSDLECCGGVCSDVENESDQQSRNDCCETICNPFFSCCCSIGYEIHSTSFDFAQLTTISINATFIGYKESCGFVPVCWQPPTVF